MKSNIKIREIVLGMSVVAYTSLFAVEDGNSRAYTDDIRNASGQSQQSTSTGKQFVDSRGDINDDYIDSVIFMDVFEKYSSNSPYAQSNTIAKQTIKLATPATDLATEASTFMLEDANKTEVEYAKSPLYFTGGMCSVVTPVEITKASEYTTLSCLLDFGNGNYREAEVFAGAYPDFEREMLILLPIYASFKNGAKANFNGVILRANKGSANVADYVDAKRVRKLLAESALATNNIAYKYATTYMVALQASKREETVRFVQTTDGNGNLVTTPISTTNVRPPNVEDFYASAGIELISQLFAVVGKEYLYDTTPLFKMYKGKRVYVEGVINFNNEGLAKKFGVIADTQLATAEKGNERWRKGIDATVKKYDSKNEQYSDKLTQILNTKAGTPKSSFGSLPTSNVRY